MNRHSSSSSRLNARVTDQVFALSLLIFGLLNGYLVWVGATSIDLGMAATVLLLALAFFYGLSIERGNLFGPLGFPLGYAALTLLGPWIYMRTTGNSIQSLQASTVESQASIVMILMVNAWICGTLFVQLTSQQYRAAPPEGVHPTNPELAIRLRAWARLLISASLLVRFYLVYESAGQAYGENQLAYTIGAAITPLADGALLISACLFMVAALSGDGRLFAIGDLGLVACVYLISLAALGSRGELLAPTIIFTYALVKLGRLKPAGLVVLGVCALPIMSLTANLRSGNNGALIETALAAISSPFMITDWLMEYVPDRTAFLNGSTYLASLKMLAPGPLSRALFPGQPETASFRFREIVNYTNPNQGYSFSLPSEAYLNWGNLGVVAVGLLVGILYAALFRPRFPQSIYASRYLYVILLAILPYSIRSDALTQLKMFIYPAVLLLIIFAIERGPSAAAKARRHVRVRKSLIPARGRRE